MDSFIIGRNTLNLIKKKLVVIDDYFNRNHFCDVLIDPTGQFIKNLIMLIKYYLAQSMF